MQSRLGPFLIFVGVCVVVGSFWLTSGAGSNGAAHHTQHTRVQQYYRAQQSHAHVSTKAIIKVSSWGRDYVMPIENSVSQKTLDSGVVGHFPHTGPLGVGNYALAGHVVTHGEPFAKLLDMTKGQTIEVDRGGRKFIFIVIDKFVVDYHNVSVLDYKRRTLTLVTCASRLFHTDNRTVVVAKLRG